MSAHRCNKGWPKLHQQHPHHRPPRPRCPPRLPCLLQPPLSLLLLLRQRRGIAPFNGPPMPGTDAEAMQQLLHVLEGEVRICADVHTYIPSYEYIHILSVTLSIRRTMTHSSIFRQSKECSGKDAACLGTSFHPSIRCAYTHANTFIHWTYAKYVLSPSNSLHLYVCVYDVCVCMNVCAYPQLYAAAYRRTIGAVTVRSRSDS